MEKEKLEGLLIDYIDNRLNAVDRRTVEQEQMTNREARKLYDELKEVISVMEQSAPLAPSSALKEKFQKDLNDAQRSARRSKTIFFNPTFYRVAAAFALMLMSGAIGFWISKNNEQQQRIAEIEREMLRVECEGLREAREGMTRSRSREELNLVDDRRSAKVFESLWSAEDVVHQDNDWETESVYFSCDEDFD